MKISKTLLGLCLSCLVLSSFAEQTAYQRGLDFLLKNQSPKGSWGSPHNTKGLNIYVPGIAAHHTYKVGCSALVLWALARDKNQDAKVKKAFHKGLNYLIKESQRLKRARADWIGNNWSHVYTIRAFLAALDNQKIDNQQRAAMKGLIQDQINSLCKFRNTDGGWGYYDLDHKLRRPGGQSTSFTTASVLIALKKAQNAGYTIPEKHLKKAIKNLQIQRKPDHSFVYSFGWRTAPMHTVNRPAGSLARSQSGNLALHLWKDPKTNSTVLKSWVDKLIKRNGWLDIARKRNQPHEGWFQTSGYYYYYGHYYASEVLTTLGKKGYALKDPLKKIILSKQERNGSWWDFPLYNYGPYYGTAYALLSLQNLD